MSSAAQYIGSVSAAAMLCAMVCGLLRVTAFQAQAKWICGIVMTVTILRPLVPVFQYHVSDFQIPQLQEGTVYSEEGKQDGKNALSEIISRQTRSYILDIAQAIGAQIEAEVILSEEDPPIPVGVIITGDISPYLKLQLEERIQEELNIPKEHQIWTG